MLVALFTQDFEAADLFLGASSRSESTVLFKKIFFLTRELSLISTCCWRADHEISMHDGGAGVH